MTTAAAATAGATTPSRPRTVWIIIGVVMLIGWGALAGILLT